MKNGDTIYVDYLGEIVAGKVEDMTKETLTIRYANGSSASPVPLELIGSRIFQSEEEALARSISNVESINQKSKVTILKMKDKTMLIGAWQICNGLYWNAENCFNYCNQDDGLNRHQAAMLERNATELSINEGCGQDDWYRNRDNFIDAEVNFHVNQDYK